ncbi:MAG: hypothetical protein JRI23_30670, partial [Deltaproteobacteria bacterium]|nr:hypothetical protein [Deltaproteobacteria bacterium]MBW2536559.1 hypothetical protein [Deltaproteobacteria bacterium]
MSDPVELAKGARLTLAEALQALQSADDAPDALLAIAEPIAKCMGLLHAIERTGGKDLSGREEALSGVRNALDSLQTVDVNHPAVDRATESIAGSLSKLFALSRAKPAGAAAPGPAAAAPA